MFRALLATCISLLITGACFADYKIVYNVEVYKDGKLISSFEEDYYRTDDGKVYQNTVIVGTDKRSIAIHDGDRSIILDPISKTAHVKTMAHARNMHVLTDFPDFPKRNLVGETVIAGSMAEGFKLGQQGEIWFLKGTKIPLKTVYVLPDGVIYVRTAKVVEVDIKLDQELFEIPEGYAVVIKR